MTVMVQRGEPMRRSCATSSVYYLVAPFPVKEDGCRLPPPHQTDDLLERQLCVCIFH